MVRVTRYNPEKTYMFPNGALAIPDEVLAQFPAILAFPHIIETDPAEQVLFAVENLAAMRGHMGIDTALTDDEAIAEIERIRNTPPPEPEPSAEERMAAALEFQNLMMMVGE